MKILLISFSGSGHTTICGQFIKKHYQDLGHQVDYYIYHHDAPFNYDINEYDLIGFGYPIHAFNVPEVFCRFIKKLPKLKEKKKYFIFKVSGEPFCFNNASSYHIYLKLKRRNFVLYAEKHFLMPYNIMFRYKDAIAKQMYLYLEALTKAYILEMENNEPEKLWYAPWHVLLSFILRIEWIAPKLNCLFVSVNKKKCIDCHKCIKECPTGAVFINKKGNIRLKATKCAMCMRCAMHCPTDAFRYGFMNPWKVNKPFLFESLVKNKEVEPEYINHSTKGYFKKFNKYFDRQKALLEKYYIPNPIEEYRIGN